MTTEAAKIIIDAEDLASKKFAIAAANAERNIKAVKETGAKAKAGTEFFGTLATTLGGTQLGSYASQLAGLTEKTSQFAEVSRLGTAGTLAFKAGLIGVAGVITYQVTTAIASAIYQTKQLEQQLNRALEGNVDSIGRLQDARARAFTQQIEDLNLREQLQDPGVDVRGEKERMLSELRKQIADTSKEITKARNEIEAYERQWLQMDPVQTAFIESEKQRVAAMKSTVTQMEAQQNILRDDLSERTKANEAIREQIEAEKEALRAKEQAAAEAERQKERLDDLLRKENERLEQQRIELEKGAEAAHAFALEKQGLAKADAERIAKEQAAIDQLKANGQTVELGTQAVESRLLTRGPMQRTAEKTLRVMEQIRDKLPLISSPSQKLEVRVVG